MYTNTSASIMNFEINNYIRNELPVLKEHINKQFSHSNEIENNNEEGR